VRNYPLQISILSQKRGNEASYNEKKTGAHHHGRKNGGDEEGETHESSLCQPDFSRRRSLTPKKRLEWKGLSPDKKHRTWGGGGWGITFRKVIKSNRRSSQVNSNGESRWEERTGRKMESGGWQFDVQETTT